MEYKFSNMNFVIKGPFQKWSDKDIRGSACVCPLPSSSLSQYLQVSTRRVSAKRPKLTFLNILKEELIKQILSQNEVPKEINSISINKNK